jgi:hypothetical protein
MVVAVVAEALVIVALVIVLDRAVVRCMRYISFKDGIPNADKPSKTMIISPYKKKKHKSDGGDGNA